MSSLLRLREVALSLNRLVLGLVFTTHGIAAIFGVLGGNVPGGGSISPWLWPYGVAALIQLVGGAFVFLGLASRPFALICSGSMAYAYFTVHAKIALLPAQNGGDEAVLFCWAFLLVALFGPGPLSLDALIGRWYRSRSRVGWGSGSGSGSDSALASVTELAPAPVTAAAATTAADAASAAPVSEAA